MAHQIDNSKGFNAFVAYAEPAWHGLGTVTTNAITVEQALQDGGLDFQVEKAPNIHRLPSGIEIVSDNSYFTYRTDVNKVLGTKVGKDYTILQNKEALDIVDIILQSGNATIETAGAINEGRKVFVCLKLNKEIEVGNSADKVKQYMLFTTSHDGSLAVTALPTNVRVVCNNTLTTALSASKQDKISIRHTSKAKDKLMQAVQIMGLVNANADRTELMYNQMLNTIISKEQMSDYFGNIFFTDVEIAKLRKGENIDELLSTRKANIIQSINEFASNGIGQDMALNNGELNMWHAYNAVTGYITRKKYSSNDDRANSMLFGAASLQLKKAADFACGVLDVQELSSKTNGVDLSNLNLN